MPRAAKKNTAPKSANNKNKQTNSIKTSNALSDDSAALGAMLSGGSGMISKRAAEPRDASLSSATLTPLSAQQIDRLWERFNSKDVRNDENFEIWPDIADAKQKKSAKMNVKEGEVNNGATVTNADNDDDNGDQTIIEYDSEEEKTLEDIVYPETLMPSVSDRSLDDVLGVPKSEDGNPSLLSRIMDPDSGGKGKNKTGLHGLIAQPKKEMSVRARMRQRIRAQQRQRSGMTAEQVVYDKRGRVVRGARQVSEEDMRSGAVRANQVDRNATKDAIRANIEKMKAEMAAKKAASSSSSSASTNQNE